MVSRACLSKPGWARIARFKVPSRPRKLSVVMNKTKGSARSPSPSRMGARSTTRQWVNRELLMPDQARVDFWCNSVGIDLDGCVAWLPDGPVALRPQEARLLALLQQKHGRVVRTEEIMSQLYGTVSSESGRLRLKSLVGEVRRRLGQLFADNLRTARGIGLILYSTSATVGYASQRHQREIGCASEATE